MMKVFGYPTFIYPAYWSLYVEELFYLSIPLWVVATRRHPLLWAYAGLALFSLIGSAVPDDLAMMKYFFFGIILCELFDTREFKKMKQYSAALILAAGVALLCFEFSSGDILGKYVAFLARGFDVRLFFDRPYNPSDPYRHYYTFTLGVGLALVIAGGVKFKPANALLSWFPFRFLGTISYSLFIWNGFLVLHNTNLYLNTMMPMVTFPEQAFPMFLEGSHLTLWGLYMPAFIVAGAASYLLIERPFLLLRNRENVLSSTLKRVEEFRGAILGFRARRTTTRSTATNRSRIFPNKNI